MKRVLVSLIVAVSVVCAIHAATPFSVSSKAVSGKGEKGFDSGIVSQGRASPAYNGGVSLPFTWTGLPKGTKAIAVVFDDPDARLVMKAYGVAGDLWVHWLATDIDPTLGGLKEGASTDLEGLIQGANTWGTTVYGGPAPPADVPKDAKRPIIHVYRLKVYALSAKTGLEEGFTLPELMKAMEGKILGMAELDMSWSN